MRVAEIRELQRKNTFMAGDYRGAPGCGRGVRPRACGGAGRDQTADRSHPSHRPGRRGLAGPVAVAAAMGDSRSGHDHGGSGGVRGPGQRLSRPVLDARPDRHPTPRREPRMIRPRLTSIPATPTIPRSAGGAASCGARTISTRPPSRIEVARSTGLRALRFERDH